MADSARTEITQVLLAAREPGGSTTTRLADVLYPELRRLAGALMWRERPGHTLQPTALVGEAFIRLIDQSRIDWKDRAHFLGVAARVMRQILVDHAREHGAAKRGGDVQRVTLDPDASPAPSAPIDLLVLHDALDRLAALDPRGAQVVELRVFGGLKVEEIAEVLGISKRTVDTDWKVSRMWLTRELSANT
jgi:RNA polymerase sigma-70 factor, ECF subfamily